MLRGLEEDGAMQPIQNLHGYHSANDAIKVRDIYKQFFNSRAGGIWKRIVNFPQLEVEFLS